jgi:hypothetical protein
VKTEDEPVRALIVVVLGKAKDVASIADRVVVLFRTEVMPALRDIGSLGDQAKAV